MNLPDPSPRTVKPHKTNYPRLPVIAIYNGETLDEAGNVGTIAALVSTLHKRESTQFIVFGASDFVAALDKHYEGKQGWQWKAMAHERCVYNPDGKHLATRVSTIVHWFGFRAGGNRGPHRYHRIIDPVSMYGKRLDEVYPGDLPPLHKLLRLGVNLRDFCHENRMQLKPTVGATAAQFLTDSRFYPELRRKVPSATNERIREVLPGNHYYLNVQPSSRQEFTAYYLDQHRAHHYHARTIGLPDANVLFAYGRFRDCETIFSNHTYDNFHGLYCLDLSAPRKRNRTYFTWLDNTKLERVFVYTSELQHLLDMGYTVKGVRAAWGSVKRDTGLAKYSVWAEEQLDQHDDAPWLKPLLLATYGVLATRIRHGEAVFKDAKSDDIVTLLTGRYKMTGRRVRSPIKLHPNYANVLHRGLIEAATRSESIGLAQYLDYEGFRVLSIYADAVIVEADDDKPLPDFLPEPWRVKTTLNHLQFVNHQAFISGEMTKLPGVTQEIRNYSRSNIGYAPRKVQYEALTGKPIRTERRI